MKFKMPLRNLRRLKNVKNTVEIILTSIAHSKALNHLVGARSQPTRHQRQDPVRIGGTRKNNNLFSCMIACFFSFVLFHVVRVSKNEGCLMGRVVNCQVHWTFLGTYPLCNSEDIAALTQILIVRPNSIVRQKLDSRGCAPLSNFDHFSIVRHKMDSRAQLADSR